MGFGMAYVPMNRARALIIVTRPEDYLPGRLREAARYLLDRKDATEEERRLASEAIELLRSKREEAKQSSTPNGVNDGQQGLGEIAVVQTALSRYLQYPVAPHT